MAAPWGHARIPVSAEILVAGADLPASALGAGRNPSDWLVLCGAPAFERVLKQRPCAKSAHFALHCLRNLELSTGCSRDAVLPVDDSAAVRLRKRPARPHLGLVVPKRHARRAVTRNLIKRQVRACWQGWWHEAASRWPGVDATDWVVRLRAPIDRKQYLSASSSGLAQALRSELPDLLQAGLKSLMRAPTRSSA